MALIELALTKHKVDTKTIKCTFQLNKIFRFYIRNIQNNVIITDKTSYFKTSSLSVLFILHPSAELLSLLKNNYYISKITVDGDHKMSISYNYKKSLFSDKNKYVNFRFTDKRLFRYVHREE